MADDKIDYIKQSVDSLHTKVDRIYDDADKRLKVLELDKAHQRGLFTGVKWAAGIVAGAVGSMLTLVANYIIKH